MRGWCFGFDVASFLREGAKIRISTTSIFGISWQSGGIIFVAEMSA